LPFASETVYNLAVLILGNWKPIPVLAAAALFGLADAAAIALQGVEVPGLGLVPVQFVQIVPYALTIAVLAGFAGRTRPPGSLGRPYPEQGVL
jgi:simple sugar transport system permease protein